MACEKKYHVAIVGGGPAGSSMADALAEAGLSVLVVDKRKKIGTPVQCAEFIHRAGFDGPKKVIAQKIENMVTHLPDGSVYLSRSPGYTIHRDKYDACLAKKAKEKGARYMMNTFGRIVNGKLIVQNGSQKEINAKVIVNASGCANSGFAAARQVTLPLGKSLKDIHVWLGPEFPGGYAWLFPKKNEANAGVAVTSPGGKANLKQILEKFIRSIEHDFNLGANRLRITGGRIPVSGITFLQEGNVIAVGDASGITHPVSGEGIYRAVRSGRIAAEAVVAFFKTGERQRLKDYPSLLLDIYGTPLKRDTEKRAMWEEAAKYGGPTIEEYKNLWIAFPEYYRKESYAKV